MAMVTCTDCGGTGKRKFGMTETTCTRCGGSGQVSDGK